MSDTTKLPTTPEELCERAAQEIKRRGWTQGKFIDKHGHVCLIGALRLASGSGPHGPVYSDVYLAARVRLRSVGRIKNLPIWNDRQVRTVAHVLALLRKVATRVSAVERTR